MSGGIDYSKWDNISDSDCDSSVEDVDSYGHMPGGVISGNNSTALSYGNNSNSCAEMELRKRGMAYEKEDSEVGWLLVGPLKNIRIHPDDSSVSMYSRIIFEEDPNTYVPDRTKYDNERVLKWGIEPPGGDVDEEELLQYTLMQSGAASFEYSRHDIQNPDTQFIDTLIGRRSKYNNSEKVTAAMKFTYVVRVELCECEKDVWRRVRVPSGIDLCKFHDQVLCPVMGWARGYHGYAFEDPSDGTVIGPQKNSAYIDTMHVPMHYKKVMDDKDCPLSGLLSKKGDIAYYTYDLGDGWEHRIVLEEIVAEEESVTLMTGEGSCPPEDSMGLEDEGGCRGYANFLKAYKRNPKKQKMKEAVQKARHSTNYLNPWMGGPPMPFKPLEFNIAYHRKMLSLMIAGPAIKTAEGSFVSPGENKYKESFKRCDSCGSRLKALSKCGGCRKAAYCSRECQENHWKVHKIECKKHSKKTKK